MSNSFCSGQHSIIHLGHNTCTHLKEMSVQADTSKAQLLVGINCLVSKCSVILRQDLIIILKVYSNCTLFPCLRASIRFQTQATSTLPYLFTHSSGQQLAHATAPIY